VLTPEIRTYAADNNIELVPLPTYASYLNRMDRRDGRITALERKLMIAA
jgi:hypothetical protein